MKVLKQMGMEQPEEERSFIATGAVTSTAAIPNNLAGMWFIAWRFIYAEIVHSRLDNVPFVARNALKRTVAVTISRLRAYGRKWRHWVCAGAYRTIPRMIPPKHRDKQILESTSEGEYGIHEDLLKLAQSLGLMTAEEVRRSQISDQSSTG